MHAVPALQASRARKFAVLLTMENASAQLSDPDLTMLLHRW